MPRKKDKPLSPRKIAKYCDVNFKTVLRWIEEGQLKKAYRLPGGSNRVSKQDLIAFLYEYNMPIPHELEPNAGRKVQLISECQKSCEKVQKFLINNGYILKTNKDIFSAGYDFEKFKPNVLILDVDLNLDVKKIIKSVISRKNNQGYYKVKVICLGSNLNQEINNDLTTSGADICVDKNNIEEMADFLK